MLRETLAVRDITPNMNIPLPIRIANRELRTGIRGFKVFLIAIILGTATIAAITSTAQNIQNSLKVQGRNILGADITLRLRHRPTDATESAYLEQLATSRNAQTSTSISMQAMAGNQTDRFLSRLKAVDDQYPLYGALILQPPVTLREVLEQNPLTNLHGAAVDPILLEQLDAQIGDLISIGEMEAEIRATILHEPDRLSDGFALGPRVLLSTTAMQQTQLMQPGSVFAHHYKIKLPDSLCDSVQIETLIENIRNDLPQSGWRIQNCTNSAPELQRFVRILTQFLILVGLMALIVGGIGVANAVRGYLDAKQATLATLKCLGASGALLFQTYMLQILALTTIGVGIGITLGALAPLPLQAPLSAILDITLDFQIQIGSLAIAAAYGFLVATGFAIYPLAAAREIRAVALFRREVAPVREYPRSRYILLTALVFVALASLLFAVTDDEEFAIWFLAIITGSILVFLALSKGIMRLAQRSSSWGSESWRIALRNIARPGSFAPNIILALGMGLTLLITVAMTDAALSSRIQRHLVDEAVAFFFLNVRSDEADDFAESLAQAEGVTEISSAPILRGKIVRVDGVPAHELDPPPDAAWVLRGDRGLSYERSLPGDSTVVSGEWWDEDYDGPPLLSLADDIAQGLGVGIGDTMTVNVLGRELTATIANTRSFEWRDIGIHFALIFTPNALQGAPHSFLFTVAMDQNVRSEADLQRSVGREYPGVTAIWIREVAAQVNRLAENIGLAIRSSSVLAVAAGMLVLGGVMAADHRRRRRESVLWKVLGATRGKVVWMYALEYLILASGAGVFGGICGIIASWVITTQVTGLEWVFTAEVLWVVPIAIAVATFLALAGAWGLLGKRAGTVLREE